MKDPSIRIEVWSGQLDEGKLLVDVKVKALDGKWNLITHVVKPVKDSLRETLASSLEVAAAEIRSQDA